MRQLINIHGFERNVAKIALLIAVVASFGGLSRSTFAQEEQKANDELAVEQAQLADRFQRLDPALGRRAELSGGTDRGRAKLLREAIAKSREQDINQRCETIVTMLEDERLSAAANRQTELQTELDELLSLLLKADRDRELD